VTRLQRALASGDRPAQGQPFLTVSQGPNNYWAPAEQTNAVIFPTPLGPAVNPMPDTLASISQVWGLRRDTWTLGNAGLIGTNDANAGWFRPVRITHAAATLQSDSICGLHFVFEGQAFEVSFAGNNAGVTMIVDGVYAASRRIVNAMVAGVLAGPLDSYNTFVRFDFGSRATRRISFYGRSTQGPVSISVGAADRLEGWDRSDEPSMAVMADSYGGASTALWGVSGLFWEAAALMGIPHCDINAIGGTGYAPNTGTPDTFNPGNTFVARVASSAVRQPDLHLTAGGINDNNGSAAPPLYDSAEQARLGFENAVFRYYRDLRSALPGTVLAAVGPWQPNVNYYWDYAIDKVEVIVAAIRAAGGPWVVVDNLRGGWLNSSGASAERTGQPWQTGTGTTANPQGDGNGDIYLSTDGTHPNEAGTSYLAGLLASQLGAAIRAL
jgi:hypothetical protein